MAVRQQAYLRALRSMGTEVHLGTFKLRRKNVRLLGLPSQLPPYTASIVLSADAEIGKYDEKGSDVNLATYLVRDAEPLRVVRSDFGVDVYLINPQRRAVAQLSRAANGTRDITLATLASCQLPLQLTDAAGIITKPKGW